MGDEFLPGEVGFDLRRLDVCRELRF